MNKKGLLKELVKDPQIKALYNEGFDRSIVNRLIVEETLRESQNMSEAEVIKLWNEIVSVLKETAIGILKATEKNQTPESFRQEIGGELQSKYNRKVSYWFSENYGLQYDTRDMIKKLDPMYEEIEKLVSLISNKVYGFEKYNNDQKTLQDILKSNPVVTKWKPIGTSTEQTGASGDFEIISKGHFVFGRPFVIVETSKGNVAVSYTHLRAHET